MQNKRAIRQLFIANTISGIAQGMSMIAIPWYFAQQDNTENPFGSIYLLFTVISIVWTLFAGLLVDRYNRKSVFLVTDVICFFVLLSIAGFGFYSNTLSNWQIGLVFGVTFLGYNIHYPSLYAFVQEITEKEQYGKLSSWIEVQAQASAAVAGGVAAFLLDKTFSSKYLGFEVELWHIFLFDALTYGIAFFLIKRIRYVPIAERFKVEGNYFKRLSGGISFLRQHTEIFKYGALAYSVFISILVLSYYLLPDYVDNVLEAPVWAFAAHETLFAVGAIVSGFTANRIFEKRPLVGMSIFILSVAIVYMLLGVYASMSLFLVGSFVMGVGNAGARILRANLIFKIVPNQVIGRISSVFHQYHTLVRILFLSVFSMAFFSEGKQVMWAFIIMSVFVAVNGLMVLGIQKEKLK